MATKQSDMAVEMILPNMKTVDACEQEMDSWLSMQPKGKRQYQHCLVFHDAETVGATITQADLDELAKRYLNAGWVTARGHLASRTMAQGQFSTDIMDVVGIMDIDRVPTLVLSTVPLRRSL